MNNLCCILGEWARCPVCDFITCEECTSEGYDNHTVGEMARSGDKNLWWFCAPTQTPIEWGSAGKLVTSVREHPCLERIDYLHDDAIEEDVRRNAYAL